MAHVVEVVYERTIEGVHKKYIMVSSTKSHEHSKRSNRAAARVPMCIETTEQSQEIIVGKYTSMAKGESEAPRKQDIERTSHHHGKAAPIASATADGDGRCVQVQLQRADTIHILPAPSTARAQSLWRAEGVRVLTTCNRHTGR